jgi:Na+(H+)/acetate symporter ActP
MTVLMSGVNMFAMAKVMQIVLGWDINFSIWVSSLTVAIYVTLGGLRSAIFNEVLQFFLIWAGALLIPILGLYEAGGLDQPQAANRAPRLGTVRPSLVGLGSFTTNPMGIHWTGIVFGLGAVISMGYWTTDFPGGAAHSGRERHSQRGNGAHHRRRIQDAGPDHRDPARPAGFGRAAGEAGSGIGGRRYRRP